MLLCIQTHMSVHQLIDEYVRAGDVPAPAVLRRYTKTVRDLAERAWAGRPASPTLTSRLL